MFTVFSVSGQCVSLLTLPFPSLFSTKHKAQLRLMRMSLVFQVFSHKPNYLKETDKIKKKKKKNHGDQSNRSQNTMWALYVSATHSYFSYASDQCLYKRHQSDVVQITGTCTWAKMLSGGGVAGDAVTDRRGDWRAADRDRDIKTFYSMFVLIKPGILSRNMISSNPNQVVFVPKSYQNINKIWT